MGIKAKLIAIYERFYESDLIMSSIYRRKYKAERLNILTSEETIRRIQETGCSVARFGEGEFELMIHDDVDLGFQKRNPALGQALRNVMSNQNEKLLLCIPYALNNIQGRTAHSRKFWFHWGKNRDQHKKITEFICQVQGKEHLFGDTQITRPYIAYNTPTHAQRVFPMLKQLWQDRDLLIIEGEKTRLGVGNDLFDNARSVRRLLCPATNAFDSYDKILETAKSVHRGGTLALLALGPTATVLAADLADAGIQALDVGHMDIEYEWFRAGVRQVTQVAGKFTNEVSGGNEVTDCENVCYLAQIVAQVE